MQSQLKRPHRAKPAEPPYAYSIVGYDTWIGVAIADAMMIAPFAVILITSHCHKLIDELIWLPTGLGQFATAGVHHYSSQYPLRNYHSRLPILRSVMGGDWRPHYLSPSSTQSPCHE
jgi:hypothetical protein